MLFPTQYDKYLVSEDGQVWSEKSQKFLKPALDKDGYVKYTLSVQGKPIYIRAHRLVAETFIPNPQNLPCINHKDENKLNNHISNLEWCDYTYNNNYGTHNQNISNTKKINGVTGKPVTMFDKKTKEPLQTFVSASEAARFLNKTNGAASILKCANHIKNYKTAYGYIWEFTQE